MFTYGDLNKIIRKRFKNVLNWRYNNEDRTSVVITFTDGSDAVYTVDKILDDKVNEKKNNIMEALTEDDITTLSDFDLTETEISHILSLFELISDENKDKAFNIIKSLFEGKKLVDSDKKTVEEKMNVKRKRNSVSERYVRTLLGGK